MGDWLAYAIVTAMLLWSMHVVLRRLMPKTAFKVQQALAIQAGKAGWLGLQQWLQPKAMQGDCAGGCSSCGSPESTCSSDADSKQDEQPVQWRPAARK